MVFCCFGCVFQKRCLAAAFLISSFIGSSSSQNWRSKLDKIGFLIGFQKVGVSASGGLVIAIDVFAFRKRCVAAGFFLFIRRSNSDQNFGRISEIRWCFAVSAVFRKRCLAAGFLLLLEAAAAAVKIGDQRSLAAGFLLFIRSSRSNQNWTKSKLDKIRFLQKGTYYCAFLFC